MLNTETSIKVIEKVLSDEDLKGLLEKPQKILITSHFKPDGDAVGSSLGLYHILRKMGHHVQVVMPSLYPSFLYWLPGNNDVVIFNQNVPQATKMIEESELIFCLDFNELKRTNGMEVYLRNSAAPKVLIDHHLEPEDFANYTISKPKASSTCELIVEFAQKLDIIDLIDEEVANCLLTGIITDTGRFKHALSPNVFNVTSFLLEKGGDMDRINTEIFDCFSEDRLRLMGFSLTEKMIVLPELKTAYIYLSIADYKRFNFQIGDNEGLVNLPLGMKDIVFSVLLSETDDLVKFSFRSKGEFPANEFAKKYFSGGGHRNASGGRFVGGFEDAIKKFEKNLHEFMAEHV